jgi:hypothetical protein
VTDSSVIKEFLYAVGFKVDEQSISKLQNSADRIEKALSNADKKSQDKAEKDAKTRATRQEDAAKKAAERKAAADKKRIEKAAADQKKAEEKSRKQLNDMFVGIGEAIAAYEIVRTFQKITDGLDSLYWQSIRIKSSAENIKTFAYGFSQVGGSVDGAKQSLTAFSDWTKYGFGSQKLLKGWFDIDATDSKTGKLKDTVELFKEVGKGLAVLEKTKGPQYTNMIAGMMGIDTSTMQVMMRDASQFEDQQKRFYREHGIDVDAAVESAHRFKLAENELFADIGDLVDKEGGDFLKWLDEGLTSVPTLGSDVLGLWKSMGQLFVSLTAFASMSDFKLFPWLDSQIKQLSDLMNAANAYFHFLKSPFGSDDAVRYLDAGNRFLNAADLQSQVANAGGRPASANEIAIAKSLKEGKSFWDSFSGASGGGPSGGGGSSSNGSSSSISLPGQSGTDSKSDYLNKLEKFAGIPAGALDALWSLESARGKNKGFSRAGALGDFQFMQETANRFGLRDRSDFATSAQAAAKYIAELLRRYGGNSQKAFAAYTAGEKRVDQAIERGGANWLSLLPNETQNYAKNVSLGSAPLMAGGGSSSSASINQKTEIHVHGSGDPKATANETANAQSRVNGQLLRNTQAALV